MAAAYASADLRFIQDTLLERLTNGLVLRDDVLAHVLASGAHKMLWDLAWPQIERNTRATLTLFDAAYPRNDVQSALCAFLYRCFDEECVDDVPRVILKALERRGTAIALPTLHSVLQKLEPQAATGNHFGRMLGVVEGLIGTWRVEMVELAKSAIDAIRDRSSHGDVNFSDSSSDRSGAKLAAEQALAKARQYEEIEPEVSAQYSRKSAEALAKWWYRSYGLEQSSGKLAKQLMLGDLIKALDRADVPALFLSTLKSCQPLSNFASHDQDEGSGEITSVMASNLIRFVEQALMFEPKLKPTPNEGGQSRL